MSSSRLTRLPNRTATMALILGVAFVSALPWLVKNAVFLGDPLYPYLGGPQLDPWLARIYGGSAVPQQVDPSAVWHTQRAFSVVDLFVAPARITVEAEGGFYRPNLLLLLPAAANSDLRLHAGEGSRIRNRQGNPYRPPCGRSALSTLTAERRTAVPHI